MTSPGGRTTPSPLLLLVIEEEMLLRSLSSVLAHDNYRVVTARDQGDALTQARGRPDAIILDTAIAELPRFAFCRALRADAEISSATPIVLVHAGPVTHTQQIDALRAGAWDLKGEPLDAAELLLQVGLYVHAKLEADRVGAEGLLDVGSGLYNVAGTVRRAAELASLSARQGLPLSCAVFRVSEADQQDNGDRVAGAFQQEGRISDVVGRTASHEFAVFAPATDAVQAAQLVERLGQRVAAQAALTRPLRAGVSTASARSEFDAIELLARARRALP